MMNEKILNHVLKFDIETWKICEGNRLERYCMTVGQTFVICSQINDSAKLLITEKKTGELIFVCKSPLIDELIFDIYQNAYKKKLARQNAFLDEINDLL